MRKKSPLAPLAFVLALILPAASIHAGVAITQVVLELNGDGHPDSNIIRIEKGKVRVDLGSDPEVYQIFRGDSAVLWTVNLREKTYSQKTGKEAEAMRAKWNDGMGKIREKPGNLPPERRKRMQDKFATMMAEAKTTYRKIGDGGKVGGWPTEKYEGFRRGEKIVEEWVAEAGALGMTESDARALREMEGYFDKYSSGWPGKGADKGNGSANVTVRTLSYRDGKPAWRTEYAAVKKESCDAGLFEIPPGLALRVVDRE